MEENVQSEQQAVEANTQVERKKRSPESESDPSAIRLKIGGALAARVREAAQELKSRGITVTAEELLSDYLENVPDRYFDGQLLKWTPERFYIETAIEKPEIREKLVREAMRSLGLFAKRKTTDGAPTRRKRKDKTIEANQQEG